jgi:hypothetical protein
VLDLGAFVQQVLGVVIKQDTQADILSQLQDVVEHLTESALTSADQAQILTTKPS